MCFVRKLLIASLVIAPLAGCSDAPEHQTVSDGAVAEDEPSIQASEFIYEDASFPSAHASTIVETPDGVAAAWFGGTDEGEPDVGIWFSRHEQGAWTAPVELADGVSEGTEYPCWNPVLFYPEGGPLVLFYKVGPNPREWWGMVRLSEDYGRTWSEEARLPDGILGPVRAKPVVLEDGSLLAGSSTEHDGWVVHMERYTVPEEGEAMWSLERLASAGAWERIGPLNEAADFEAIQPTLLMHSPSTIQIMCRSRQDVITEAWSEDGGQSWGPMTATSLPNPSAGIDAVKLDDASFVLIYNPTTDGRRQLALAASDDGRAWDRFLMLEDAPGEYSYPAIIQGSDGLLHITYTWKRERIKYVTVDPANI